MVQMKGGPSQESSREYFQHNFWVRWPVKKLIDNELTQVPDTEDSEGEDSAEENFEVERIVDYKRVSYEQS